MAQVNVSTANYAPYRRAGDMVYFSGLIAADPARGRLILGYDDLPEEHREAAGKTGSMSTDMIQGPIAAQAWFIFTTLRAMLTELGGSLDDVVHLNQYLTDVREFPIYDQVRATFFPSVPASTVLEVSQMLPSPEMRIEVQAIAYLPRS